MRRKIHFVSEFKLYNETEGTQTFYNAKSGLASTVLSPTAQPKIEICGVNIGHDATPLYAGADK